MKFNLNKKGFIGAIGDDLPSLIPIIIAILIFFSVFTNTLMVYDQKNSELRKQIELSSISRTIKGESLIYGYDFFIDSCTATKLKRSNYNYMIALYSNDFLINEGINQIVQDFIETSQNDSPSSSFIEDQDSGEIFFCNYKKIGGSKFSEKTRNYLIRFYPIALQTNIDLGGEDYYFIEPVILAMVVWD